MDQVCFTFAQIAAALGDQAQWLGSFEPEKELKYIFTDTRETAEDSLFIAFSGENFDAHDFLEKAVQSGAQLLCVEKDKLNKLPTSLSVPVVAVKSTLAAYQAIANYHRRRFPALRLLALTGSCGKTSTKETLRAILEEAFGKEHVLATEGNFNNQIGVPRTLLRLTESHQVAVLECGTNHHGEIEPLALCAEPESSMIVSIGNCHLEYLGSLEGVAQEKSHIFKYLPKNGTAVIPLNAAGFDIMKNAADGRRTVTFGLDPAADFSARYLGGNLYGSSFELTKRATGEKAVIQWRIPGEHQAGNAAGAAALADTLGISFEKIAKGIENTVLPGMRMRVSELGFATWINDAYNANPDSMKASLNWLKEFADPAHFVLALGDMGELGDGAAAGHRSVLERAFELFPAARIYTVGKKMKDAAKNFPVVKSYEDAASAAEDFAKEIRPGDLVFLKASRSTGLEKLEAAVKLPKLSQYLRALSIVGGKCSALKENEDPEIRFVTNKAADVREGALFCAIKGAKFDGHDFLAQAIANGAAAVVVHQSCPMCNPAIPVIRVSDSYYAWGILCDEMHGRPSEHYCVHGITGTNGKTSTAMLLHHLLTAGAGRKAGLLTTVFTDTCEPDGRRSEAANTMPDAMALQGLFHRIGQNNADDVVMECSSHGLSQARSGRTRYYSAIFTNLTGDHLDYHKDMESYYLAKKRLFTDFAVTAMPAVINVDDPYGKRLYDELGATKVNPLSVSLNDENADYYVSNVKLTGSGSSFDVTWFAGTQHLTSPLSGLHNVYNTVCAFAAAVEILADDADMEKLLAAVANAPAAPGRLERFELANGASAFVDYAHTDDALERVTAALNTIKKDGARLITVFGCGGDRDRTKRPRMGKAASAASDVVIVTSDNPRSEDPGSIIAEILPGIPEGTAYFVESDRAAAIALAVEKSSAGDLILIAGKGHENYQEIRGVKHHFDDREEIRKFM